MKHIKLAVLTAVAIAAFSAAGINHISGHADDDDSLLVENIETLTQNEDPNISYGYELNPCYEDITIDGQTYRKETGAVCAPTNPYGTCRRSWQWGQCQ